MPLCLVFTFNFSREKRIEIEIGVKDVEGKLNCRIELNNFYVGSRATRSNFDMVKVRCTNDAI